MTENKKIIPIEKWIFSRRDPESNKFYLSTKIGNKYLIITEGGLKGNDGYSVPITDKCYYKIECYKLPYRWDWFGTKKIIEKDKLCKEFGIKNEFIGAYDDEASQKHIKMCIKYANMEVE